MTISGFFSFLKLDQLSNTQSVKETGERAAILLGTGCRPQVCVALPANKQGVAWS